jgi:hypothetical protein
VTTPGPCYNPNCPERGQHEHGWATDGDGNYVTTTIWPPGQILGPVTKDHILVYVLDGPEPSHFDTMQAMMEGIANQYGDNSPLVIGMPPGGTLELLDEDAMFDAGWIRVERVDEMAAKVGEMIDGVQP